jgi:hypothetical protein
LARLARSYDCERLHHRDGSLGHRLDRVTHDHTEQ